MTPRTPEFIESSLFTKMVYDYMSEDAFLKLPAPQRKIIREVILTFAKVHCVSTTPSAG